MTLIFYLYDCAGNACCRSSLQSRHFVLGSSIGSSLVTSSLINPFVWSCHEARKRTLLLNSSSGFT